MNEANLIRWCGPLFGVVMLLAGGRTMAQVQPCDSLGATLAHEPDTVDLGVLLSVELPPQAEPVGIVFWYFADGSVQTSLGGELHHQFPGAGVQPVCAALSVVDNQQLDTCSLFVCGLVDVQEPHCPGVEPEFTVVVSGDTVEFIDQTTAFSGASVVGLAWDLGDGATAIGSAPQHVFTTPGPHEVCLTVSAVDSTQQPCTSTVCHWYYSGPVDPPCEDVLTVSFDHAVLPNGQVALWSTSLTSGMTGEHLWDLGDGTQATGPFALHSYPFGGLVQICLSVSVSGPLFTDSCTATTCSWIDLTGLLGVEEPEAAQSLRARPNPAGERITVELPVGVNSGHLQLVDLLDRPHLDVAVHGERQDLVVSGVPTGAYLLVFRSGGVMMSTRIMVAH